MAAVDNVIVQGLFCVRLIQVLDGGWNEGFKPASLLLPRSFSPVSPYGSTKPVHMQVLAVDRIVQPRLRKNTADLRLGTRSET